MVSAVSLGRSTASGCLRAVFLDLMGTVIFDPYLDALKAGTGMAVLEAHRFKDRQSWPDFELGLIDEDEFVRRFWAAEEQDRPFDVTAFHAARREGYAFLPGMAQLLDDLGGQVKRYVASNYPVWIEELAAQFDFTARFDGVFASCYVGVRKPDEGFYHQMLAATGHQAPECLFVDDREANCAAAEAVGMRAHLFTGADRLRRRLEAEGVLNETPRR